MANGLSQLRFVYLFSQDAVALPSTPEKPEEVEEQLGVFAEEEEEEDSDDSEDSDYLPSQGQQSVSSASIFNPSSQKLEVCTWRVLFDYRIFVTKPIKSFFSVVTQ